MRIIRTLGLLLVLAATPLVASADPSFAKGKEKDRERRRFDVTTFGPVALGRANGLRLCHANHFGSETIGVEWVFVAIAPPNPALPPASGEPTQEVGRLKFDLPPLTGNCAEFAPDLGQQPEGVSIIAVLIGLRRNGRSTLDVVGSAQVVELVPGGGGAAGLLLPAVQKEKVMLSAIP